MVLVPVLAIMAAMISVATSPTTTAQLNGLCVTITSYEDEKIYPGSSFNVTFTLTKPAGIDVPTGAGNKVYLSMFYFPDGTPKFPSEYVESPYIAGKTEYALTGKMKSDAPVGQKCFLGAYWQIRLDSSFSPTSPSEGDNATVSINGTQYTAKIIRVDPKEKYTYYYIVDEPGWDVYLRSDKPDALYVRALKSNVEIKAAPGFEVPWSVVIGGVVVLLVVVAVVVVVLKKRGGAEVPPPPPPPSL
jgi:hypothetical protein